MKRTLASIVLLVVAAAVNLSQTEDKKSAAVDASVKEALITLEKQGWEAWKNRDSKFVQNNMPEDGISVTAAGFEDKAAMVKSVSSSDCEIKSYSLDNINVKMLDPNTAILMFKGNQAGTCKGKAIPAAVWASSIYVKRGGKWVNVFYQETPAETAQ